MDSLEIDPAGQDWLYRCLLAEQAEANGMPAYFIDFLYDADRYATPVKRKYLG
jgi:hypothetical protein